MARLDLGGLRDLWYRIDDIFARLTEAAGSIALSGTSLVLSAVSGGTLSTVDLNGTFATDAEAGHSLSWNSPNLTLNSVNGGSLGSVNLNTGLATDAEAAHALSLSNSSLVLKSVSGQTLSTVSLETLIDNAVSSGTSGLLHVSTADALYGRALSWNSTTKTLSLISRDGTTISSVILPV